MLDIYKVAFLGDSCTEDKEKVEKLLEQYLKELVDENWYVDVLVGHNSDFDKSVVSVLKKIHREYKSFNSALILYLPRFYPEYVENKEEFDKKYTDVIICNFEFDADIRLATKLSKQRMIDDADLVVFYTKQECIEMSQAVQYAVIREKTIINLE